jgi:hypothetical protein
MFGSLYRPCGKSHEVTVKPVVDVVRFEVFTAVTRKNGVFWDVTPCGSFNNGCFGGN